MFNLISSIDKKERFRLFAEFLFAVSGVTALVIIAVANGFYLNGTQFQLLQYISYLNIFLYFTFELMQLLLLFKLKDYIRERKGEILLPVMLAANLLLPDLVKQFLDIVLLGDNSPHIEFSYLCFTQSFIFFIILIKALRYNHLLAKLKLPPEIIFAAGFILTILTGTLALLLPKSVPVGTTIKFIDSLFTSTSAVCVTGLVAVDTALTFTDFGKIVILFLIQVGGLGVMTFTTFFASFFAGGMSFHYRLLVKDMINSDNLNEVSKMIIRILSFTFLIELAGAVSLFISLGGNFFHPDPQLVYHSIYHSVSAFCNAGFSLYSMNLMDVHVQTNYMFTSTIMMLIICGGIGFSVLANISSLRPKRFAKKRLRFQLTVHSKIVLLTTLILIVVGGLLIYLSESQNKFINLVWYEKLYHAVFHGVSARTAGFNTLALENYAPVSAIFLIVLMWVGASPGSTGGGIKTTTFALTTLAFKNIIRGKSRLEVFHREIDRESITKAFMIIFASILTLLIAIIILIWIEPNKAPLDLVFEATSAFGTVGLSRNLTFFIGSGAKVVLIVLMFIGRIGVLTFFLLFFKPSKEVNYSFPKTSVMIG